MLTSSSLHLTTEDVQIHIINKFLLARKEPYTCICTYQSFTPVHMKRKRAKNTNLFRKLSFFLGPLRMHSTAQLCISQTRFKHILGDAQLKASVTCPLWLISWVHWQLNFSGKRHWKSFRVKLNLQQLRDLNWEKITTFIHTDNRTETRLSVQHFFPRRWTRDLQDAGGLTFYQVTISIQFHPNLTLTSSLVIISYHYYFQKLQIMMKRVQKTTSFIPAPGDLNLPLLLCPWLHTQTFSGENMQLSRICHSENKQMSLTFLAMEKPVTWYTPCFKAMLETHCICDIRLIIVLAHAAIPS